MKDRTAPGELTTNPFRFVLATEYLGDEWFDLINACADCQSNEFA